MFYIVAEPNKKWFDLNYENISFCEMNLYKIYTHLLFVELEKQEDFYTKRNEYKVFDVILSKKYRPEYCIFYTNLDNYELFFFENINEILYHPKWDEWQNYNALKYIENLI